MCALWSFTEKVCDLWVNGILGYSNWERCLRSCLLMGKQKQKGVCSKLVSTGPRPPVWVDASVSYPVPSLWHPFSDSSPCIHHARWCISARACVRWKDPPSSSASVSPRLFRSYVSLYVVLQPLKIALTVQSKGCSLARHTYKMCHLPDSRVRTSGPPLNALKSKHQAHENSTLRLHFFDSPEEDVWANIFMRLVGGLQGKGHFRTTGTSLSSSSSYVKLMCVTNLVALKDGPVSFPYILWFQKSVILDISNWWMLHLLCQALSMGLETEPCSWEHCGVILRDIRPCTSSSLSRNDPDPHSGKKLTLCLLDGS